MEKFTLMRKMILAILAIAFINLTTANSVNVNQIAAVNSTTSATAKPHKKASKHRKKHHRNTKKNLHSVAPLTTNNQNTLASAPAASANYTNKSPRQLRLYSYSAYAINAKTGAILVSKNPNVKLPIASITKLMTAIVLLDSGVSLDDYVTISSDDIDNMRNTFSRLKVGMQFRRRDLLLLALMSSENRAAHALARTTYKGGLNVFITKMNQTAKNLGMNNTQFYEPTGLDEQNQSTAQDLSKMVQHAYNYPQIRKYTTTKDASVMFGPRYVHRYINSDLLVRNSNKIQIEVSKTGFINEAGHCLVLYSIVNNQPIIMAFLNSSKSGRILDAMNVKNYILRQSNT